MKAAKNLFLKSAGILLVTIVAAIATSGCGNSDPPATNSQPDLANFLQAPVLDMTTLTCVTSCTTNADCQNSCPPASSGVTCCDTATNTCFNAQATSCPAPVDMSVVGPY